MYVMRGFNRHIHKRPEQKENMEKRGFGRVKERLEGVCVGLETGTFSARGRMGGDLLGLPRALL